MELKLQQPLYLTNLTTQWIRHPERSHLSCQKQRGYNEGSCLLCGLLKRKTLEATYRVTSSLFTCISTKKNPQGTITTQYQSHSSFAWVSGKGGLGEGGGRRSPWYYWAVMVLESAGRVTIIPSWCGYPIRGDQYFLSRPSWQANQDGKTIIEVRVMICFCGTGIPRVRWS